MKRILITIVTCAVIMVNLLIADTAQAQAIAILPLAKVSEPANLITQLETEILPQLESIFTPEQREQFRTAIAEGTPFRKAFKSLMLTPEQKTQLKALFKTLPKKDAFAALTPEQKKKLFVRSKGQFIPTSEEIAARINARASSKGTPLSEEAKQKISDKLKAKESIIPTPEEISAKISAGMTMIKKKIEK